MGIFDFFKKKKTELEIETIGFNEIKEFLSKKRQEIEGKQSQPKKQVEEILSELIKKLEERVEILENVELKNKKALEMEKLIVKQNLTNFVYHLKKLVSDLKKVNLGSFETLIDEINSVFSEFEKKSLISFQKSTYLIGEELGGVRDNIAKFFRSINGIVKENIFLVDQKKIISFIKEKLNEIESLEKIEYENKEIIVDIENKIKNLEEKIKNQRGEIANIKRGQEYLKQINSKQELEKTKTKLTIELQKLKEMIDFKALARVYHSAENQMRIIKYYRDNFKESFERNGSEKLLELIDIKDINQEPIKEKIALIDKLKQDIDNIKIEEDITEGLNKNIDYIKTKIAELNSEKLRKERIDKKFQENKEQMKRQISEQLKSFNAVLE